ncbi:MAG TPA: sugar nucleotide-binding protein, partial [Pseudomonadales bacterium]|nr:sugar nucleotide-binding protein [Pseudomonadales bacterium]
MKVLLTGATGQLGHALIRSAPATVELVALDRAALDLVQPEGLAALIEQHRPALLINAAAYTAVDRAEQEPELAQRINAQAVAALAAACSAS